MKITFSLKNHETIVKIDKKQNPLKSIAENGSSLLQRIWIVWSVEGGTKVSKHPVDKKQDVVRCITQTQDAMVAPIKLVLLSFFYINQGGLGALLTPAKLL